MSAKTLGCSIDSLNTVEKIQINSMVELNEALVNSVVPKFYKNENEFFNEAIELQLKHILGFFRNTSVDIVNAALSSYRSKIEINKIERGIEYQNGYFFASYLNRDWNKSNFKYQELGFNQKKLSKNGIRVSYTTDLILSDCTSKNNISNYKILVPRDPYFSYWIENPVYYQTISLNDQQIKKSSCHANDLIKFGSPEQLWFFWNPLACTNVDPNFLSEVHIQKRAKLKKDFNLKNIFPNKNLPLKSYIVLGKISDDEKLNLNDLKQTKEMLAKAVNYCLKSNLVSDCLTSFPQSLEKHIKELTQNYLIIFLSEINTIVKLKKFKIEITNNLEIMFKLSGNLRLSGRQINLHGIYARTNLDYGAPITDAYKKFLEDAFLEADTFSYLGHSGLGENLKIKNLEKQIKGFEKIKRTKPIWIGLYNCEGFSYFGLDFKKIFDKKVNPKIYLTLSTGVEADVKFPLAQIANLNSLDFENFPDNINQLIFSKDYYVDVLIE